MGPYFCGIRAIKLYVDRCSTGMCAQRGESMSCYRVEGGFPVSGCIRVCGNKNAALPCIAAAVLTQEPVLLQNVPDIEDVAVMLTIFRAFGGSVERRGNHEYMLHLPQLQTCEVPCEAAQKVRASILFAGPLLARGRKAVLPLPGGDVIGRRRLDTHFLALAALGAQVRLDGVFTFSANKLVGCDVFLDEASVTATENVLMASVLAEGVTVITNAASEPHVQDLCHLLNAMGARVSGIGSNVLTIEGVSALHGTTYTLGADFMEVGSLIGLAVVTRGALTISDVNVRDLRPLGFAFKKLGVIWSEQEHAVSVSASQDLRVNYDFGGMIPKIDDGPWPAFPPDLTSIMTVVATQVEGVILIHEKMFESRMFFVDKLITMGARIILCDPHRALVSGPSALHGSDLVSPDVRAGMAMVLAACCARGVSIIRNVYQIERGYERLVERLQAIGVRIWKEG